MDALTDELTTSLARMSGTISGVFVIARNTAMTYKGKPVYAKAIGKDLGVRYVLEGSVQPSGNQVRVNAQLIDADSGAHLWAEQFDTPRADLLQTQDEIVTVLARAMELQLPQAEAARAKRTRAASPDAEDMALQGFAAVVKGGFVGKEADAGYALCEQALRVDPNNVRALWVLSMKFHLPVLFGMSADPKADLKRADELVSQALALDPANAAAHNSKACDSPRAGALRGGHRGAGTDARLGPGRLERHDEHGLGITSASGDMKRVWKYSRRAIGSARAVQS